LSCRRCRSTECRYCRYPAPKGRCHSNHFLALYIRGAHWRHLANMIQPSMCGGDAALCQITLTTCFSLLYLTCKSVQNHCNSVSYSLEMWANAKRDGHPAEYRWRPPFNAAVWRTPTTRVPCSNAAKAQNLLKFTGVPQTHQQISAASGPNFTIY